MFRTIATRILGMAAVAFALAGAAPAAHARALSVEVWTDRGDDAVYQPGDAMQVKVRTNDDAYLLVYEIDSNGKVTELYPWRRAGGMVEAHHTYRLPPEDSNYELAVEQATGEGYIVAIASQAPFRDLPWYLRPADPQGESNGYVNDHDSEEGFDQNGDVIGDPMVAMERIRRRVLTEPNDTEAFASSYTTYYVGHEVRYPRYICADCHSAQHWAWWDGFDPYYTTCPVVDFRVNWGWAWGPVCWNGYVPYYYFVVRADCPPRFRHFYDDHARWSSWDGRRRWDALFGGPLTRYKSAPPPGWQGPSTRLAGGYTPPGYIPGSPGLRSGSTRGYIGRDGRPIPGSSDPNRGAQWRSPVGSGQSARPMPAVRMPGGQSPRYEGGVRYRPAYRPAPQGGSYRQAPRGANRPENRGGGGRSSRGGEGHASGGHEHGGR